jgi:hypothetical protein
MIAVPWEEGLSSRGQPFSISVACNSNVGCALMIGHARHRRRIPPHGSQLP